MILNDLYGYAVTEDRDGLLQRVTVGELRQNAAYAELRHALTWRAVDRAGLPPFQGAAWQEHTTTSLDLMIAETLLALATEDDAP